MICTFKFYTERDQRIAAFAEVANDQLMIVLFICSSKDSFSKKMAKVAFEHWKRSLPHTPVYAVGHLFHPRQLVIYFKGDARAEFLNYMELNFYRKGIHVLHYEQPILYKRRLARNEEFPEGSFVGRIKEKGLLVDDPVVQRTHYIGNREVIQVGKGRIRIRKMGEHT